MKTMKKLTTISIMAVLLLLCGCEDAGFQNQETRFVLNTVAKITANASDETLNGAFVLCEELEKLLSRTVDGSDVFKLNSTNDFVKVSSDTKKVIERSLYYSEISGGLFDITIYPVSSLWDFKDQIIPQKDEIAEALKSVDYESIEIKGDEISLHGKKIDLGGIAKGYIADRLTDYLKTEGVSSAIVNLGGNIKVIGEFNIGIKNPNEDSVILNVKVENQSIVTSGIYERKIEKNGELYHHILNPKTGYGVKNSLASVTVISENSIDCDALSTVCVLLGKEEGLKLINSLENTEAVFIEKNGSHTLTNGLYEENSQIYFKKVGK